MRLSIVLVSFSLGIAGVGCKPPPQQPAASSDPAMQVPSGAATPEAEARQLFAGRCSPCHGAEGAGDGAAAAAINPHPRNFHDPTWQSTVTDAQIENIIRVGGAAVGKSPAMPPNPDLASKPAVVTALRGLIRGFH